MITLEQIGVGATANDGTGDALRTGGIKINANNDKLFVLTRVVQSNTLQVFKAFGNENINVLEVGDLVKGLWDSSLFIDLAIYNGGSPGDLSSYQIINQYIINEDS